MHKLTCKQHERSFLTCAYVRVCNSLGKTAAAKSEAEAQKEKADKPRTLLEASKELKRATEAMDSRTQRFVKQQDEESRVLAEANQVAVCT